MRGKRLAAALWALTLLSLLSPIAATADHVTADPQVSAAGEPFTETSWIVVVDWAIGCSVGDGTYGGNLYLIDAVTRESIYMGGTFQASGTDRQPVQRKGTVRRMYPLIQASCNSGLPDLHGSGTFEASGNTVLIPPIGGDRGGRGGGGGGQGDRDFPRGVVGDPTDPLRGGGCAATLRGSDRDETLHGTGAADSIFGLGGRDVVRGRGDDDCLLGHRGADRILGHGGWDRLTGGPGADVLIGGGGRNRYDAGAGNDLVIAANGRNEIVSCGTGAGDRARVDRGDRVGGCERLTR